MFREVHQRITGSTVLRLNPAFRDLGGIFGDSRKLVLIDYCHTTESANLQIAAAIVDDVIGALRRAPLAASKHERNVSEGGGEPLR